MKHGKKPTVAQKKFMQAEGLNPQEWLVMKDTPYMMEVVKRDLSEKQKLKKGGE